MSKNRSHSVDAAIDRIDRESEVGGGRLVDLAMAFLLVEEPVNDNAPAQSLLFSAGGVWDKRIGDFDGKAKQGVVVRLHPGQRRALEWFKSWLEAHSDRRVKPPKFTAKDLEDDKFEIDVHPAHAYSALFAGGRRAGKTWIAIAAAVVYAIMYPKAIVWIVSPNDRKHDEIRRYLANTIAEPWLERQTAFEYDFVNGSSIHLKSGHDPELLKDGKANLIIMNEGQMMKHRAFVLCRGAIVDQSGLVIVCANPPVEAGDQVWVTDFAAEAAAGRRAAVYIEFNPLLNPHIDRSALLAFRTELDERSFAIEVLGQFRGPKDAVAWNWIRLENELAVPDDYVDVTESFLAIAGEGPGITTIVGLDVQRFPYIGGPWYRLFVPRGVFPTPSTVVAWIVGETVLDGGDEVDFCDELSDAELKPESTLIVCDASGRYQHSRRRTVDSPPPEWKGRGSFDIIRSEGYIRIVPPDRRMKRNPEIVDRARAFTSMICSGVGNRRLFADPVAAPKTCHAIRDWRVKHGQPSRTQDVAHLGDGASYPIVRLFPRRLRSKEKSTNHGPVKDAVTSKVDLPIAQVATNELRILPSSPRGRPSRTRGL